VKALIAEDDPIWRASIEALLVRWGYTAVAVDNGLSALDLLEAEDAPRLAILDWVMPGLDGIEICRRLRQRTSGPYIYTILVTAMDRKEDTIRGLEAGADDYVAKPFDAHELRVRLRVGQRIVELQEALLKAQEDLRIQATHDALTGLLNHGAIVEILHRELSRAKRDSSFVGVIMADLDHFKRVNDTYGHLAGDAVLREAARRFQSEARAYDAIGRYGGEEFLLVMPGGDAPGARHLAERILHAVSSETFTFPGGTVDLTVSLGVVARDDGIDTDPASIVKAADDALYRAKREGRNRIVLAGPRDLELAGQEVRAAGTELSGPGPAPDPIPRP
jgi:diguanylate cyclase (GGDEF)-like protein